MSLMHNPLKSFICLFLFCIALLAPLLAPPIGYANDLGITPTVAEVVEGYTNKYCLEIANGRNPKMAAEVASRQMISGLIFSGALKEVMALPKEEMAAFVASKIFYECGSDIVISQQDLNEYLIELADTGNNQDQSEPQPFKPFGMG